MVFGRWSAVRRCVCSVCGGVVVVERCSSPSGFWWSAVCSRCGRSASAEPGRGWVVGFQGEPLEPPPDKVAQNSEEKMTVASGLFTESRTKKVNVSLSGRSLSAGFRAQLPSEDGDPTFEEHGLRRRIVWCVGDGRTERTPEAVAVSGVSCPAGAGVKDPGPGKLSDEKIKKEGR